MEQEKIGKFILALRKEKNMTQQNNIINVSCNFLCIINIAPNRCFYNIIISSSISSIKRCFNTFVLHMHISDNVV